jgi:protein-L-isoaspartate O-methyltransferase
VVPAGPEGNQQLLRIVRLEQGLERQVLGAVSFVPLVGGVG